VRDAGEHVGRIGWPSRVTRAPRIGRAIRRNASGR
jgi:hypothetical protein